MGGLQEALSLGYISPTCDRAGDQGSRRLWGGGEALSGP